MQPSLWLSATRTPIDQHHRPPRRLLVAKLTRCTGQAGPVHRLRCKSTHSDDPTTSSSSVAAPDALSQPDDDDLDNLAPQTTYQRVFAPFVAKVLSLICNAVVEHIDTHHRIHHSTRCFSRWRRSVESTTSTTVPRCSSCPSTPPGSTLPPPSSLSVSRAHWG